MARRLNTERERLEEYLLTNLLKRSVDEATLAAMTQEARQARKSLAWLHRRNLKRQRDILTLELLRSQLDRLTAQFAAPNRHGQRA